MGVPGWGQAAPEPLKLGSVTVQGSFRSRLEVWDWFEGNGNSDYAYSGNVLKLGFSQSRARLDWQLEFEAPFLLGLPQDAIAPAPQGALGLGGNYFTANSNRRNAGMVLVNQGYLRFKNLFGDPAQSLRVGRFEFSDGGEVMPKNATLAAVKRDRVAQRLVGPFGWSHVGRSFDGIHYAANGSRTNFTLVGAVPTRGAFQVDGWGELNVALGYASVTRQVGSGKKQAGEWRLMGIYYHDWRPVLKTDNRSAAARRADPAHIRIASYGGHYLHAAETGSGVFDLMLWGVGQAGRFGRLDHRAFAADIEAGWQPKIWPKLKPWLRGGFFHGSGDGNPNDSTHGTFFQVLPTPRPFARFPFFDLINNQDRFGMVVLRPHAAVTLRSEFHALRLADAADLWYQGGGAFQPQSFGYVGRSGGGARSLANLYDLSADWNVNRNLTLTGYFGYAQGEAVMKSIYPRGKDGKFGYLEVVYRF